MRSCFFLFFFCGQHMSRSQWGLKISWGNINLKLVKMMQPWSKSSNTTSYGQCYQTMQKYMYKVQLAGFLVLSQLLKWWQREKLMNERPHRESIFQFMFNQWMSLSGSSKKVLHNVTYSHLLISYIQALRVLPQYK